MYKYIIIVLLILGCSPSTVNEDVYVEPQKYFSYLAMEGVGTDNYITELSGSSNITTISSCKEIGDITRVINLIIEARNNDMKCILWLDHWLFGIENWGTPEQALFLREDYQEQITILKIELSPYIESIHMFYVLDEPYWNGSQIGISPSDMLMMLETVTLVLKDTFPEIKVGSCFAYPSIDENFKIPESYTLVGFSHYYPGQDLKAYFEKYKNLLAEFTSKMYSHQKLFLVPGGFQFTHNPATSDDLIQVADFFYNIFINETSAEVMVVFLYPTLPGLTGLIDLPEVMGRYEQIGVLIINQK